MNLLSQVMSQQMRSSGALGKALTIVPSQADSSSCDNDIVSTSV